MEAVSYCLKAVASQGDTIIVESPTYPWFLQMIEDLKMLALELPTHPQTGIARYFPKDTRITTPKGGFSLWVELNPGVDSLAVYSEAQRHRIAILPGIMCSTTPKFNHFIRLSCGFPWSEALEQGIRTLGEIVHKTAKARVVKTA